MSFSGGGKISTMRRIKKKSMFSGTLGRRLFKKASAKQITEGTSGNDSELEHEDFRAYQRRVGKKGSVAEEQKGKVLKDLQYDGDKLVDENNMNVEESMKRVLAAKAKDRRNEIFDLAFDEDETGSLRSRNSTKTFRTDNEDSTLERAKLRANSLATGGRKNRSVLGFTLRRKASSNKSLYGRDREKSFNNSRLKNLKIPNFPKSDLDKKLIRDALKANMFFSALPDDEVELITNAMQERKIEVDSFVTIEGEKGDEFFVVKQGSFEITKPSENKKLDTVGQGSSFGELSLIHDSTRQTSIRAREESTVFTLDRTSYRKVVAYSEDDRLRQIRKVLFRVPLLSSLSRDQIDMIAECVQVVRFAAGDPIIVKGQMGEIFYMIKSGTVQCTRIGNEGDDLKDVRLGPNDYFGERALMVNEPRAANVVAIEQVECLALDRDSFVKHLGSLKDLMLQNLSLKTLKSVPLFHDQPDKRLMRILQSMEKDEFVDGQQIIEQGSNNKKLYIILEGEVEVKLYDKSDRMKHTVLATLKKGQYFGESSLKVNKLSSAEVVAVGKVVCQSINVRRHMKLIKPLTSSIKKQTHLRKERAMEAVQKNSFAVDSSESALTLENLTAIRTLGTGTFGRVKLVEHKSTSNCYALKILQKVSIVRNKQTKNVLSEKAVMIKSDHPFILKLHRTFVTRNCLYFLLEYIQGGELFSLLQNAEEQRLPGRQAKFYTACVVDAITYLHKRKIVYRDLKPENLLLDSEGYIRVVDFGFAKKVEKKTFTLCGTPEYLAPEIVKVMGHNRAVDYWAIGVLVYEMLCGFSPFSPLDDHGGNEIIFQQIIKGRFSFPGNFPRYARMLVNSLMQPVPNDRLGMLKDGPDEIKSHKWFKDLDFDKLLAKEVRAPWIPKITDAKDASYFDTYDEDDEETPYKGSNKYWQNF